MKLKVEYEKKQRIKTTTTKPSDFKQVHLMSMPCLQEMVLLQGAEYCIQFK